MDLPSRVLRSGQEHIGPIRFRQYLPSSVNVAEMELKKIPITWLFGMLGLKIKKTVNTNILCGNKIVKISNH